MGDWATNSNDPDPALPMSAVHLHGSGWAATGDAAGLANPMNGEGSDYGLEPGMLLADLFLPDSAAAPAPTTASSASAAAGSCAPGLLWRCSRRRWPTSRRSPTSPVSGDGQFRRRRTRDGSAGHRRRGLEFADPLLCRVLMETTGDYNSRAAHRTARSRDRLGFTGRHPALRRLPGPASVVGQRGPVKFAACACGVHRLRAATLARRARRGRRPPR